MKTLSIGKSDSRARNILVAFSLGLVAMSIGIALHFSGITRFQGQGRRLAEVILLNTYNPWNHTMTSYSLNAVSAVIWDIRGIDTILETIVLLASIIGVAVLFENKTKPSIQPDTSPIVKSTTKTILALTLVIALSTAIHGHLSPGGGFQSGVMMTSVIVLTFPILNIYAYLIAKKEELITLRLILLGMILLVALIPALQYPLTGVYGYIMQNQSKYDSPFSMPSWFIDTPTAGSILLYNFLESFTVFIALIYSILLIYTSREE